MRTAIKLNQELRDLWTMNDLCDALSITPMTVQAWRRERELPTVVFPGKLRHAIRFVPEEIRQWATKRGLRVKVKRIMLEQAA